MCQRVAFPSHPGCGGCGLKERLRTLRAEGGPSFVEELVKYDDAGRNYQYKIDKVDPKVLPVNNYVAWMEVLPNPAGGSTLEWRAAFYRGYMLNDPPPDLNDVASSKAVTGVIRAGLEAMIGCHLAMASKSLMTAQT